MHSDMLSIVVVQGVVVVFKNSVVLLKRKLNRHLEEKWMDWMGMGVEEQGPEMDLFRHVRERLLTGVEASKSLVALYDGQDRLQHANKAFRHAFSMRDEIGRAAWRERECKSA